MVLVVGGCKVMSDWYLGKYVRRINLEKGGNVIHLYGVAHPMNFGWKVRDVLGGLCLERHLFLQRPITS